jgi:hypothetical protein
MAYPYKYYRYLNLPKIPSDIFINYNFDEYEKKVQGLINPGYVWTDSFNNEINEWCKKNICDDMYYAFQIIKTDIGIHTDNQTKIKFLYVLETGGDNVITEWYSEDNTVVDSVVIQPNKWCVIKVDYPHAVKNIESGKTRFAITGRIF